MIFFVVVAAVVAVAVAVAVAAALVVLMLVEVESSLGILWFCPHGADVERRGVPWSHPGTLLYGSIRGVVLPGMSRRGP